MNPLSYIHDESVRQSATVAEMAGMCKAYSWLLKKNNAFGVDLNEHTIKVISGYLTGNLDYRRVPAVFHQGRPAVNAENIPRLMNVWVETVNSSFKYEGQDGLTVDDFIQEFLDIHPFADGNGRVASLLRNYLLGTLSDPTPLPYYFGEN